ncbi:hypothetical protein QR680_016749 [Steinernema hermaphroditum]|uniref:Uncharacterized protein n=1 Tax=Steinernema hermaphroditum TaxID=289476 RepID=A0AA39HE59_9BILA|nr:hypothetical protein QR680_016749 [Steinernema hermaphroditum]
MSSSSDKKINMSLDQIIRMDKKSKKAGGVVKKGRVEKKTPKGFQKGPQKSARKGNISKAQKCGFKKNVRNGTNRVHSKNVQKKVAKPPRVFPTKNNPGRVVKQRNIPMMASFGKNVRPVPKANSDKNRGAFKGPQRRDSPQARLFAIQNRLRHQNRH